VTGKIDVRDEAGGKAERERLRLPDRRRACPGRSFRIGGYSL